MTRIWNRGSDAAGSGSWPQNIERLLLDGVNEPGVKVMLDRHMNRARSCRSRWAECSRPGRSG